MNKKILEYYRREQINLEGKKTNLNELREADKDKSNSVIAFNTSKTNTISRAVETKFMRKERIRELEIEIHFKGRELKKIRSRIEGFIKLLSLPESSVLKGYYIHLLSWKEIAKNMRISVQRVFQIRKKAFEKLNF
jgi:DNA-directed RNA polymerase specialized sigma subunit